MVFPSEHAATAVTLWIAVTHALPAFECAPRLVFTSPQKRCGKTRALDIVQALSHDPLATADATVAAIFRSIRDDHPRTLFIDEADAIWGSKKLAEQHEDLRKLLNAGHQRGRPALRCVGQSQIPTEFETFAMVALAGIGDCIPDTITDRAINIKLSRRSSTEKVSAFRSRRDKPKLEELGKRLAAWAGEQIENLQTAEPDDMPVEDRAADTWEPLIAVADTAGGHWPDTARKACKALVGEADDADEDRSYGVRLLADIKSIFEQHGTFFLPSQQLVNDLRSIDESPWGDFELTRSKLAYRLREFGIKTGHNTAGSARGYRVEDFWDAFGRYTRQEPSKPSDPLVKGGFPSDGPTRQTKTTRQTKIGLLPGNLTVLTPSDVGTAQNVQPEPPPGAPTEKTDGYTDNVKRIVDKARAKAAATPGADVEPDIADVEPAI